MKWRRVELSCGGKIRDGALRLREVQCKILITRSISADCFGTKSHKTRVVCVCVQLFHTQHCFMDQNKHPAQKVELPSEQNVKKNTIEH